MSDVLDNIIEHKKIEVDARKKERPLSYFSKELNVSTRSLYKSLYKSSIINNQPAYILECKKASPSKGLINKNFDIPSIVNVYDKYASGISVLTDKKFFQGRFDYIKQAKQMTNRPILCKDFFIDIYQVYEARYFGADAILLMLSVLDDETYLELAHIANQFELDVLTEVHDKTELDRAIKLDAKIIGINNRNLKDLSISLKTTEQLAPQIDIKTNSGIRPLIISESGIGNNSDIVRLRHQVDGFLVGSHLMASSDLENSCASLIFANIKICGLTQREDILNAKEQGATFAGLIFYKKSPRYIKPSDALSITKNIALNFVGVFVNKDIENMIAIAKQLKLFAIQLHGNESEETVIELKKHLNGIQIWKAIPVSEKSNAEDIAQFINKSSADKFLLDTKTDQFGGTGFQFDWQVIKSLPSFLENGRTLNNDIILAGGLSPKNIAQAKLHPCFAFDINSGIEDSAGKKSKIKLEQLFQQISTRVKLNE